MREEKVSYENSQGQKIVGLLTKPENDGPFHAVVGVHGFRSTKDRTKITRIAQELCDKGIAMLRIDLTNIGESEPDFTETTLGRDADSAKCGVKYLEKRDDIGSIGFYGSSMGGITVLIAADSSIKAIALTAPVTYFDYHLKYPREWEDMKKQGFSYTVSGSGHKYKLNKAFVDEALEHDIEEIAKGIKCPVLIVHGDDDKSVNIEYSRKILKFMDARLVEIPGCTHNFERPEDLDMLVNSVVGFFVKNL